MREKREMRGSSLWSIKWGAKCRTRKSTQLASAMIESIGIQPSETAGSNIPPFTSYSVSTKFMVYG